MAMCNVVCCMVLVVRALKRFGVPLGAGMYLVNAHCS